MDAASHLAETERHMRAGEPAEALAELERYWAWRRQSGAEPFRGADALAHRLGQQVRSRIQELRDDSIPGPVSMAEVIDELAFQRGWQRPQPQRHEGTGDNANK